MFDNEPYESDNEYLDESYKDIDYRRNDQAVFAISISSSVSFSDSVNG
jgi:hypothetical protein